MPPGLLPIAPPGTLPAPLRDRPVVELDLTDVEAMDLVYPLLQAAEALPSDQVLRARIRDLNWSASAALQAHNFHFQIMPPERPGEQVLVVWHRYLPGMRREIHEHFPPLHTYRVRSAPAPERAALPGSEVGSG